MKLYLLRHGKADWPNWDKPDDERPLTKEGKKEAEAMGRFLAKLEIKPVILTSPLPRASQTVEITAKCLDAVVHTETALRPGFGTEQLRKLARNFEDKSLMIVGHEPDFSHTIHQLTGGHAKMSKGGVALIELETDSMEGELRWLLPPKLARA